MLSFDHFSVDIGCIDFYLLEREATPESGMKIDIQRRLGGFALWDTVLILEKLGAIGIEPLHRWLQKADLQPTDSQSNTSWSMKQRFSSILNDIGCTLPSVPRSLTAKRHRATPNTARIVHTHAQNEGFVDTNLCGIFVHCSAHWSNDRQTGCRVALRNTESRESHWRQRL